MACNGCESERSRLASVLRTRSNVPVEIVGNVQKNLPKRLFISCNLSNLQIHA
jgi:hypothetical protein